MHKHHDQICDDPGCGDNRLASSPAAPSPTPSIALVLGGRAVETNLIGRRVRVWLGRSVMKALEEKTPIRYEGTVRAVGASNYGLLLWIEQECEAGGRWQPVGSLFTAGTEDGILLL